MACGHKGIVPSAERQGFTAGVIMFDCKSLACSPEEQVGRVRAAFERTFAPLGVAEPNLGLLVRSAPVWPNDRGMARVLVPPQLVQGSDSITLGAHLAELSRVMGYEVAAAEGHKFRLCDYSRTEEQRGTLGGPIEYLEPGVRARFPMPHQWEWRSLSLAQADAAENGAAMMPFAWQFPEYWRLGAPQLPTGYEAFCGWISTGAKFLLYLRMDSARKPGTLRIHVYHSDSVSS